MAFASRYVTFLNEDRTEMLTCWPGIWNFGVGETWTLERASRPERAATWGPPSVLPSFKGGLERLTEYAQREGLSVVELVS